MVSPAVSTGKATEPAKAPVVPPRPAAAAYFASADWQKLRSVRDRTLKNNPDLAAEYKALLKDMDEQQKELEAAMVKADPKVIPVIAKLDLIRKKNTLTSVAPGSSH